MIIILLLQIRKLIRDTQGKPLRSRQEAAFASAWATGGKYVRGTSIMLSSSK